MYPGPGRAGKSSIAALAFLLLAEIPAAQLPDAIAVEKNISAAFRAELKGEPLRVGLYEKPPFVQFHSDSSRTGNGRFYGISVEQMNELSSKFNFSVYVSIRMVSGWSQDRRFACPRMQHRAPGRLSRSEFSS